MSAQTVAVTPQSQQLNASLDAAFHPAPRVQQNLTAAAEKRILIWLAHRLPRWVNSDHLTELGAAGMFLAGLCYALASWTPYALLAANFFLALNWFGDSLDGTLARVRNCQRPRYGFYVDHVADAFGIAALLGGMALSGVMHPAIAAALLVSFLLLFVEVCLATYCVGRFQMSFWRLGPTELRLALIFGNLALLLRPPQLHWLGTTWQMYDVAGAVGAAGLLLTALVSAARNTRQLYHQETNREETVLKMRSV